MRIIIQTVVYGSETGSLNAQKRRKLSMFEMMCLKRREKCGCELCAVEITECNVLKVVWAY